MLALFHFGGGCYIDYLTAGERTAELARDLGDSRMIARAGFHRAHALQMLGQVEESLRVSEEAIAWGQETGGTLYLWNVFSVKGYTQIFRGEFDAARHAIQQSITIAERHGDPLASSLDIALSRHMQLFLSGQWVQARKNIEQIIATLAQYGHDFVFNYSQLALGTLSMAEGQWQEANPLLETAADGATRAGDMQGMRHAARAMAELAILRGQPDIAVARLVPLLDRPGLEEFDVTYFLPILAWAHLEAGDIIRAEQAIDQALRRARAQTLRLVAVDALWVQAQILVRRREWRQATGALDEGLTLARAMPYPYSEARLLRVQGSIHVSRHEQQPAAARLSEARAIFEKLGARKDVEETERLQRQLHGQGSFC